MNLWAQTKDLYKSGTGFMRHGITWGKTREIFHGDSMGLRVKWCMEFLCHVGKNVRKLPWSFRGILWSFHRKFDVFSPWNCMGCNWDCYCAELPNLSCFPRVRLIAGVGQKSSFACTSEFVCGIFLQIGLRILKLVAEDGDLGFRRTIRYYIVDGLPPLHVYLCRVHSVLWHSWASRKNSFGLWKYNSTNWIYTKLFTGSTNLHRYLWSYLLTSKVLPINRMTYLLTYIYRLEEPIV